MLLLDLIPSRLDGLLDGCLDRRFTGVRAGRLDGHLDSRLAGGRDGSRGGHRDGNRSWYKFASLTEI